METLRLKIEKDIAILEFDRTELHVNVLDTTCMQELAAAIETLKAAAKDGLRALIITSRKDGIFIAGADIKEIEDIRTTDDAREKAAKGREVLSALYDLDLITVAAINGACLGGGYELALWCRYRTAAFGDKVKIGLPEVGLGVIPGFGGTQRLPRVVGLTQALNMILPGQILSASEALRYGAVDRLFPENRLLEDSVEFANGILDGKIKVEKKRRTLLQLFLEETSLGRTFLFSQARKNVLKKTKGFYPAPLKALEVIRRTYGRDIKMGCRLESEAFGELVVTDVSKNLIKVFFLSEHYKKFHWVDADVAPFSINKCAVVGAGVMGGGIAQLMSFRDIPTRLKDINYEALMSGLRTASGLYEYALKKRKLKKHQVDYKLGLISPTLTYAGFENADLAIEAVVEDLEVKKRVFKELSQIASPKTILASNTSSLPIIKIGELANSPERVIGLHFFNPVHLMPLVEVIRSAKTNDETVASTIAFARRLGKVVVVVKDVPGFLINRLLLPYLNEAGFLVEEGVDMARIDRVVRAFGMPMGPVELADEIGIDVGYKVAAILEESYGRRMEVSSILKKAKENGLLGKKTKCGFYIHKGKEKMPNKDIYRLIKRADKIQISDGALLKRLLYLMINEAARCLEEGVADSPSSVDIGMIMGTGFPPFRGGLLRYADSVGADMIASELKVFEKELKHERFKPCRYLTGLADKKGKFYAD